MSLSQAASLQCIYKRNTSCASISCSEECSLLLCRRETEESVEFETETSMISQTTESFDCNELLCKPEEETSQFSTPQWTHIGFREVEEHSADSHNLSEESLLSFHYSSISEDSRNSSNLSSWLFHLDEETEEHYLSMTRIELRERYLREKMSLQKAEEALNPNYMACRPLLLEWICDICVELELTPETLHTAVYLLDSFMFKQKLDYQFLQALSCACILVAGKITGKQEEREQNVPRVEELVYLCRQSFSSETLIIMEKILLEVLEWNILTCHSIHFLRFFLFQWCRQCSDILQKKTYSMKSQAIGELALYLVNRAMIDKNCFGCSPSCLAATSVYCSLFCLFGEPFLEDACHLHILLADHSYFFGECISKQVELFQPWYLEKQFPQTTRAPIRQCSPTCIQEMLSFNYGGHCTSFC
ncbi:hypothetical protein GpartN1_g3233.t1 [Galdieria partita]|uniref:Cyclin-like domain-containing protein n=1 Tax=Galdieria partita TaxID=83374 RepID=A0A9C7PXT4_9RHOD|nr:hypothetical protein GpartN1_g3233.t1 [Galdieria partita]